jgi:Fic family protein
MRIAFRGNFMGRLERMLFTVLDLTPDERAVFERIEDMRYQLRHLVGDPRRWALINGAETAAADGRTWQAERGYRQAIDFILQRCRSRDFRFTRDMLLTVHFLITQDHLQSNPGQLRLGWVGVRNSETGRIVHQGVDRDRLDFVLSEIIDSLNDASLLPTIVRAAMAHLNLVLAHPFSDGNGRTARCIQTALLAQDGMIAPEFSSIEEYVRTNRADYYAVLSEVGGGTWAPERDAHPWVRFCLTAHYRQAKALLRNAGIVSIAELIRCWLLTNIRLKDPARWQLH